MEPGRARGRLPKPTIRFDPDSGIALEGGVIIIKCEARIDGLKRFHIFKRSEPIFKVTTDSNSTAVFTITNVTSKNNGIYRCVYYKERPSPIRSEPSNIIRLTVQGIKAPLSILQPASAAVIKGDNLSMSCTTVTNGWCFFYQDYHDASSNLPIAEERSNVTVSITTVDFCDQRSYSCQCLIEYNGTKAYTARSNLMQVNIFGRLPKPTISFDPDSGIALEGGVIIIKCEAGINGSKEFHLLKGGEQILSAYTDSNSPAVFTIPNVTSKNDGIYSCIYHNDLPCPKASEASDDIRLNVQAGIKAPLSILQPASAAVIKGDNLSMSCTTVTDGWCFLYQDYHDAYWNLPIAKERSNVTVSITAVNVCDGGSYSCQCLVEWNGTKVYAARSNLMQVNIFDRQEPKYKPAGTGSSNKIPVALSLVFTSFVVLILISALLGVVLSKKIPATDQPRSQGETVSIQPCPLKHAVYYLIYAKKPKSVNVKL
ncbi:immunoglobulin superfamily member 1-like isoform X2 [Cetorhinus maximus]